MSAFFPSSLRRGLPAGALLAALLAGCAQMPEQPQPLQQQQPQPEPPPPPQPYLPGHLVDQPTLPSLGLPSRVFYLSALDGGLDISAPHKMTRADMDQAAAGRLPPRQTFEMMASGQGPWMSAALNWPLAQNFWLHTAPGARAEFGDDALTVRMSGEVQLKIDDFTASKGKGILVSSNQGSVSVRVRRLPRNGEIKITAPALTLLASQPGEYRVDANPNANTISVTVRSGAARVAPADSKSSQSMPIASGRQITFSPGASPGVLNVVGSGPAPGRDAFDQWAAGRDAMLDTPSDAAQYVSPDMPGAQALNGYGQWAQDPAYGPVWYPAVTDSGWTPYTDGNWAWIEPWGWTWVDAAPWGFAPYHYGRWALIGQRWAWAPGSKSQPPVYASALVGFGDGGRNSGRVPGQDWFPLAPGEYWQPDAVPVPAPASNGGNPAIPAPGYGGAPGYDAGGSAYDSGDDGYAPATDGGSGGAGRARPPRQPQPPQRPNGAPPPRHPGDSAPPQRPGGAPPPLQRPNGSSPPQRPAGSPPSQRPGGSPPPQRPSAPAPSRPSAPPPARPSAPPPSSSPSHSSSPSSSSSSRSSANSDDKKK